MKTKTKMPKAMYGKTMMKKGGIKKMQKGGVKKSLSKAQLGENFQGPVTKKTNELVNKEYKEYTGPRVYDQDVKDADELKRLRENYDRIPKEKKGGAVKKKMMTGGMANSNAKVSYQKVAGSKGVMSGVNPKASASNVASSRGTGGVNTPPSQAVPAAKRGGVIKKMQKGGSTSAALRKAKPVPSSRSANAQKSPGTGIAKAASKMQRGGISKSDYDKVNKKGISIKPAKNKLLTPSQISVVNKTGISIPKKKMQKGGMIKRK